MYIEPIKEFDVCFPEDPLQGCLHGPPSLGLSVEANRGSPRDLARTVPGLLRLLHGYEADPPGVYDQGINLKVTS